MNSHHATESRIDRVLLGSALAVAVLTVLLHVVAAVALRDSFWGLHLYAFFPGAILAVASISIALICTVVLIKRESTESWSLQNIGGSMLNRQWVVLGVLMVLGTLAFWLFRTNHTYLGDGTVLIHSIADGQKFHPREPLTIMTQQALYQLLGPLLGVGERPDADVARDAIALGSVAAGTIFILLAWGISREVVRLRQYKGPDKRLGFIAALALTLILLTQGYMQLFFGYVENYSYYTMSVALYLWLSLRYLRGAGPLLVPAAALLLGMAFHIGFVILFPSFGILCIWALMSPPKRVGAIRDIVITGGALWGLHMAFAAVQSDFSLFSSLLQTTGIAVSREHENVPMLSVKHVRDFFNEQFLIGPMGLFLFVVAAVMTLVMRRWRSGTAAYLLIVGLSFLGASWLAGDSNLGYARDWDVWAAGSVVFLTAGLGLFLMPGRGAKTKTRTSGATLMAGLGVALLISLYHTVPWIAVNASTDRGLERLKTLPLGLGRTEVLVSQWYRQHDNEAERLSWLQKAIVVYPRNSNAHYLLGIYYNEKGDSRSAADAFSEAIKYRPDKLQFRHLLIDALTDLGRFEETLPHFEFSLQQEPGSAKRWMLYAQALQKSGQSEKATTVLERAAPMYADIVEQNPGDYESNLAYGWILYSIGSPEESLTYFEASLKINPNAVAPVCLMGYSLRRLGRNDEAVETFTRCLELDPNRSDGPAINAWIRQATRQ